MKRRAGRTDANQTAIVKAFRALGAGVTILSSVGDGCPDLLVSYAGDWMPVEVKDGSKSASAQRLTPCEVAWANRQKARASVVRSAEDVAALLRRMAGGAT